MKISPLATFLLATASGVAAGPMPEDTTSPEYLVSISYSANDCTDAVFLQTFLSNTTRQYMGSTGMDSCADNLMCRVDPAGNPDMCPIPTGSGENETTKMYEVMSFVNETDGKIYSGRGRLNGPDMCRVSSGSWFRGCGSYGQKFLVDLQSNPEIMANDNPEDLEKMQDFLYLIYYEDDACTDLASVITTASGQELTFPTVSDPDLSCRMQAICGVDPTSDACVRIRDGSSPAEALQFRSESRVDEATGEVGVYTCTLGNGAADEDECNVRKPQDCIKSSVFSNCSFRYLAGPTLAQNPRFLVGEFENDPDTSGVSPGASKVFTSIGFFVFSLLYVNAAWWL